MASKEDIPDHWDWKELGDLGKFRNGKYIPNKDYGDEGDYPVYGSNGIMGYTDNKWVENRAIAIGRVGSCGEINVAKPDSWISDNAIVYWPDDTKVKFSFITYYLRKKNIASLKTESAQPLIRQGDVKEIKIPVPPLGEQEMIVEKLDEIFDSIEEIQDAQKEAEELEEKLKVSVIASELEDYDNEEKIEDVISRIKGGSSADQHDEPRGYPVSRIETIADAEVDPDSVKYVNIDKKEYKKHVMQEGDILFSNINSPAHVGKTAIYDGVPEDLIHGMNLVLIRANEEIILPEFLELSLTFEKNKGTFKNMCKQAVNQASLAQRDIKPIEITVPPLEDQKEIMHKISSIRIQIREIFGSHDQAEEITEALPKSVLAEAFKGNLVDFGATSESDELGSTEQGIDEKQESSFDGEGQQSLGEYR